MVTTESPKRETERSSITSGRLAIANSTGYVTNCSISSVPRLGATVITCTWLFVISGTEPRLIVAIDQIPVPRSATINNPTINLLLMENEMILLIIKRKV